MIDLTARPLVGYEPEYPYTDHGWGGHDPVFQEVVNEIVPQTVIEVGSYLGQSTITLAQLIRRLPPAGRVVYAVDTWLGSLEHMDQPSDLGFAWRHGYPDMYWRFASNVVHKGVAEFVVPVPQTSYAAAQYLGGKGVRADLIFVDGSHLYRDVYQDCESYWPLLRSGGVLLGHDWTGPWTDVYDAVTDWAQQYVGIEIEDRGEFWVVRKA